MVEIMVWDYTVVLMMVAGHVSPAHVLFLLLSFFYTVMRTTDYGEIPRNKFSSTLENYFTNFTMHK